jgi:OOP family OmpA-OmpF porin
MRIASVVTAIGLAAAAFALPAAAQNRGFYIGYNAGQSKYNFNCTGSCDDKGAGYSLFAGFGLTPNIAAEFGYTDLGKTTFGPSNLRANVWHGSAVGSWWFGARQSFGVYGRLGVYTGDLKATTPSTGAEVKHGTTDLLYGIGGQYNLSSRFGTRLEWQRFTGMGGGGFNQTGDVDLISIGLLYKF